MAHSLFLENIGWACLAFAIASLFLLADKPSGPIARMMRHGVLLLYVVFDIWMISAALGVAGIISTAQEKNTWAWVAIGWSLAGVRSATLWLRQHQRMRTPVAVTPHMPRQIEPRRWQYALRGLSFVMATIICSNAILIGADLNAGIESWWSRSSASAGLVTTAAGHGIAFVAGYAYSLLLSGALVKLLSHSLRQDWGVSRRWNFTLLAGPYLLPALAGGDIYPGLWAGMATHVATLYAGWCWTDAPPTGLLGTLKDVRNLRERSKLDSLNLTPHDDHVISARRGHVISVSPGGTLPDDDSQLNVIGLQVPRGAVTLGYSRTKLILVGKSALICHDFAEVTEVWLVPPATIQLCIGVDPAVTIRWKDRAKGGTQEFASRLASGRSARLAAGQL